jgi:hypothetical protein
MYACSLSLLTLACSPGSSINGRITALRALSLPPSSPTSACRPALSSCEWTCVHGRRTPPSSSTGPPTPTALPGLSLQPSYRRQYPRSNSSGGSCRNGRAQVGISGQEDPILPRSSFPTNWASTSAFVTTTMAGSTGRGCFGRSSPPRLAPRCAGLCIHANHWLHFIPTHYLFPGVQACVYTLTIGYLFPGVQACVYTLTIGYTLYPLTTCSQVPYAVLAQHIVQCTPTHYSVLVPRCQCGWGTMHTTGPSPK